jgi:hypothetical protein
MIVHFQFQRNNHYYFFSKHESEQVRLLEISTASAGQDKDHDVIILKPRRIAKSVPATRPEKSGR